MQSATLSKEEYDDYTKAFKEVYPHLIYQKFLGTPAAAVSVGTSACLKIAKDVCHLDTTKLDSAKDIIDQNLFPFMLNYNLFGYWGVATFLAYKLGLKLYNKV